MEKTEMRKIHKDAIEWVLYADTPKDMIFCYCGGESFESHHEAIWSVKHRRLMEITQESCPKCGHVDNVHCIQPPKGPQSLEGR